jgi:transcriptional regulator with XRE-family HTH domain
MALKLPKARRDDVERRAWELSAKGWSQQRIAGELDVDQSTVSRTLERVHKRALEDLGAVTRLKLVTLVDQIDHVIDESLQGFDRSKRPKKSVKKRTEPNPAAYEPDPFGTRDKSNPPPATLESTTQALDERDGDPAFLYAFYAGTDRLRKLLNLDDLTKPKGDVAGDGTTIRDVQAEALEADAAYVPDPPSPPPAEPTT